MNFSFFLFFFFAHNTTTLKLPFLSVYIHCLYITYTTMDLSEATQYFDGGIIFVSYIISVIGAQTTLELLTRRTHIHGLYNW